MAVEAALCLGPPDSPLRLVPPPPSIRERGSAASREPVGSSQPHRNRRQPHPSSAPARALCQPGIGGLPTARTRASVDWFGGGSRSVGRGGSALWVGLRRRSHESSRPKYCSRRRSLRHRACRARSTTGRRAAVLRSDSRSPRPQCRPGCIRPAPGSTRRARATGRVIDFGSHRQREAPQQQRHRPPFHCRTRAPRHYGTERAALVARLDEELQCFIRFALASSSLSRRLYTSSARQP